MSTFEVKPIIEFRTRQRVNKLFRNGRCLVDEFIAEVRLDKNLAPELGELFATMEDVANGQLVPKNRYRKLHLSGKLRYPAFEAKSKHLRLYLIYEKETGQIHILGGKKTDQSKDLKKVESIIREYSLSKS